MKNCINFRKWSETKYQQFSGDGCCVKLSLRELVKMLLAKFTVQDPEVVAKYGYHLWNVEAKNAPIVGPVVTRKLWASH